MNLHQLVQVNLTPEQLWRIGAGIERLLMECRDAEERAELLAIRKEITVAQTTAAMEGEEGGSTFTVHSSGVAKSPPPEGMQGVGSALSVPIAPLRLLCHNHQVVIANILAGRN
jgi:hypothetical protein